MLEFHQHTAGNDRITLFAEVILPLSIPKTYTYRVPYALRSAIQVGRRVVVQFGKSRIYTAIVVDITQQAPERYEAKYLLDVLDEAPVVNERQLRLWRWLAGYYLCYEGEVMQAALPAALKLASETKIVAVQAGGVDRDMLNDQEVLIMDALDIASELRVSDIVKLLGQKTVFPVIKRLFDKGFIRISEELTEKYRPRRRIFVQLNPLFATEEAKRMMFEELDRAPKQLDAVLAWIQLNRGGGRVSKASVLESSGCGHSAFKALVDKEIFIAEERDVSRLDGAEVLLEASFELSPAQRDALAAIERGFAEKEVALLHGVTASGKTEVYIRLIERVLQEGRTVLYLLPEIGLTTQAIARLRLHFGQEAGVYHSRFNDNERAEVWHKVLEGGYKVVLGARSAVFLPFRDLGLIIVDEEHESSFKQFDPAPRYHARDTAIYLGKLHGAKVLLGSATPSVESYHNASAGKYALAELKERYGKARLPDIRLVNLTEERRKNKNVTYFTPQLLEHMEHALARKEQVILFQNRRGHTPVLICRICGYAPKCISCDVSLTYHKSTGKLHCHYCGFREDVLQVCPACGSTQIESRGGGTERIEEELGLLMPEARIGRLDIDAARGKYGFERILNDFDEGRLDILIGTQMVAKGLDFGNVSVIGVINADMLIHYPDFRAYERAFSLLSQVAGRAGRRDTPGVVIMQAYSTEHRILKQVLANDYRGMFTAERDEREQYGYPPFSRLIHIHVKHKVREKAYNSATRLAVALREVLSTRVLGPEVPLVSRVRTYYIFTIMLKIERDGISISKVKEAVASIVTAFYTDKNNKGAFIQLDVDPA